MIALTECTRLEIKKSGKSSSPGELFSVALSSFLSDTICMIKLKKSPISFVRSEVKVKGKTEHLGRGFYECEIADGDVKGFVEKLEKKIKDWKKKDLIEYSKRNEDGALEFAFKKEALRNENDSYYRSFVVNEKNPYPVYVCFFTMND